ncbi:C6 zinc finger domain-containing protein [Nannizzia gypsea CBS 118893]|uniref:C6 zinc finger domain-containing protein n=1 Tax=Arthroderma gypseum (strain ATCC MYA-4604 / CBS 118893) TaxID=535722 RepID=E4UPD8_ARTGP|nr:C6 zinc finger domain-containing protein [Nannizzia gypsea CBS 118893]EFQ99027.1 C6 zinc finger domain-containing protein [Nannizzia gypsea CBS 118893]
MSERDERGRDEQRKKRKRATTACLACRARKTKCDNRRPCSFCAANGVACAYTETSPTVEPSHSDLLERINHAVALLEALPQASPSHHNIKPASASVHIEAGVDRSDFTADGFGQLEIPEAAAALIACESSLSWSCFSGLPAVQAVSSFLLQSDAGFDSDGIGTGIGIGIGIGRGIDEVDAVPLCQRFLDSFYQRNPVLDPVELLADARRISEHGFGWDGRTCLVLLACALGSLPHANHVPYSKRASVSASSPVPSSRTVSDAYYAAARKRLGTLDPSVLAVKCYCYAGIYEKSIFQPLRAWPLFQHACAQYQAYLWRKANFPPRPTVEQNTTSYTEQRLYWFCVKTECELRAELRLPRGSIIEFKYPGSFSGLSMPPPTGASGPAEESSWFYYLAEISLRRIMNSVLEAFYCRQESWWSTHNFALLLSQFTSFSDQLDLWRQHIPLPLQFDDLETPDSEFALLLKGRYFTCLEWTQRPFLHYVLHHTPDDPYYPQAVPIAQRSLQSCSNLIVACSYNHRHGATWSVVRRALTCAILLLAAARGRFYAPSVDWEAGIRTTVQYIAKWEREAVDLQWANRVLQDILHDTLKRQSSI